MGGQPFFPAELSAGGGEACPTCKVARGRTFPKVLPCEGFPRFVFAASLREERMWKMRIRLAVFALVLIFAAVLCSCDSGTKTDGVPGDNKVPASVLALASSVTEDLEARGYEVVRGYMQLFTMDDCALAVAKTGQCFGNNPTGPYVFPVVPAWSEEYIDPTTLNVFGENADGYLTIRRFDPREATLVFGVMPPSARYFGLQTYQYTREDTVDTDNEVYQFVLNTFPFMLDQFFGPAPNGRLLSFASISNNNNNAVFERRAGSFFDQVRFFVVTPDQAMDTAVRAALARAEVSDRDIVTESIASPVTLGLDKEADDLITVIRYALPDDEQAGELWRRDLPLVVLRVRDRGDRAPEPWPAFEHPQERFDTSELYLSTDLNALNNNVRAAWGLDPVPNPPGVADRMLDLQRAYPFDLVGPDCIRNTMNCLADTQDTSYAGTANVYLENEAGDPFLYAVVGTLGTETGNATYTSLAVYRAAVVMGVANVEDGQLLQSQSYFPQEPNAFNNQDKFYLWYFARNCAAAPEAICTEINEDQIPLGEPMKLALRNYIRPGDVRGPNTDPPDDPKGVSPLLPAWVTAIPLP